MKAFEEWLQEYELNHFPNSINYENIKNAWKEALRWVLTQKTYCYDEGGEVMDFIPIDKIKEELGDE